MRASPASSGSVDARRRPQRPALQLHPAAPAGSTRSRPSAWTLADAALTWFAAERVDLVLVLGDVVQTRTRRPGHMLAAAPPGSPRWPRSAATTTCGSAPSSARAPPARIRLLYEEPLTIDGVDVAGVEIDRIPAAAVRRRAGRTEGSILLVASLPGALEASRVAGDGIPYAGDIVNRAELEAGLRAAGRPTVVLSGHIHVRCSTDDGTLLQFTVGALIESPFDATIVELDAAALEVRRTSRRLGEPAPFDPVLAADEERRRWDGGWLAVASSGAGSAVDRDIAPVRYDASSNEEGDGGGDLLGPAGALDHRVGERPLGRRRRRGTRCSSASRSAPGRRRCSGCSRRRSRSRSRASAESRRLRGAVGGVAPEADQPADRRVVDDRAASAPEHRRDRVLLHR